MFLLIIVHETRDRQITSLRPSPHRLPHRRPSKRSFQKTISNYRPASPKTKSKMFRFPCPPPAVLTLRLGKLMLRLSLLR
jgi:hypothetical protein